MFETGKPTYIIAEAGVNHNGHLDLAHKLVEIAHASGADAVKFQTFSADALTTKSAPMAEYQKANLGQDGDQHAMLKQLELGAEDFAKLAAQCESLGIDFLSTPFDPLSADLLNGLGMKAFKIPSGELTNPELVGHVATFGKPLILSTGMGTLGEIEEALDLIDRAGNEVCILHCVSDYPAQPQDANLRAMDTIAAAFGRPVGWSDHTLGEVVSIAAVARGARVIEKHFTIDTTMTGPDHKASLTPDELTSMVRGIRTVELALGNGRKGPTARELATKAVARRSIAAACDIAAGTVITREMLTFRRPGTGLAPRLLDMVVGRTARQAIEAGVVIDLGQIG